MKDSGKQHIQDLEEIMRALADVWPADRDNVAVAGARFEGVIENFDSNFSQLQKLIDLAWRGLKHLYEKDDYFMSVKHGTLQAVNTIREYVVNEGDIPVEDFERAFFELEKAIEGGTESADEVIELEKTEPAEDDSTSNDLEEPVTLDDLATFVMMLDEENITEKELKQLCIKINCVLQNFEIKDSQSMQQIRDALEAFCDKPACQKDWLAELSAQIETAMNILSDEEWAETESAAEVKKIEPEAEGTSEPESKTATGSGEVFYLSDDIEMSMLGEFVTECSDLLEMAESALLDLEEKPNDDELINTVFRSFHTIKGTSAFMGLSPISEFTHLVETLLSMVRDGDLPFDSACADITLESIDVIKQMLAFIETASVGDALPNPDKYDGLVRALNKIANQGESPTDALSEEKVLWMKDISKPATDMPAAATNGESKQDSETPDSEKLEKMVDKGGAKPEVESTVRVNVSRLDRLIDMVGELVIAHSVVAQDAAIPKDSELQKKVNHTTKILRELQDTSLTLRMVPLKATFHKMNRLVRDLTRKAGKSVKFSTSGEDTEIDRNMVDIISEPLVHMLRNAIDHGIEDPEQRAQYGKPEAASISLRASQEGGKVVIEIEDDGRGINKEKILDKAIQKGLVEPDKKLTDKEIFNLIFLPGFSSVDKVTDLSGRGVGMDVVRRSIEQLQGKVDVSSELGKGTKITLELPFTLAITDGMLVRVGSQRYIVPTINIDMTFRAQHEDLFTILNASEQVSFRGQSVPVVRLHKLFGVQDGKEDLLEGTLLVIRNNNKRYALLVDEVIGQQQLVGKSINMMVKMPHISGGAILGDGQVGLILDTATLMMN